MRKGIIATCIILSMTVLYAFTIPSSSNRKTCKINKIESVSSYAQPKLAGKVFKNGETYLEFKSSNKGVYSFSDGSNDVVRNFTWSEKFLYEKKNYTKHRFVWQITISLEMSYGAKEIKGFLDTYEDGSVASDMNIDGNLYKLF